jgi:hypothetical protein
MGRPARVKLLGRRFIKQHDMAGAGEEVMREGAEVGAKTSHNGHKGARRLRSSRFDGHRPPLQKK